MTFRALAALSFAVAALATPAAAKPVKPFSVAALTAAQAHGDAVLVDAFAPWCPICRAQAPTIESMTTDPAYARVQVLHLDYDHQVAERKLLGIKMQSTLIAFHGRRETGRLVGVTDPAQIRQLAASSVK
jgi:thioredoxin 1